MGRNPRYNQILFRGYGGLHTPVGHQSPLPCSRPGTEPRPRIHLNDFSLRSEPCLCAAPPDSSGGAQRSIREAHSALCRQSFPASVLNRPPNWHRPRKQQDGKGLSALGAQSLPPPVLYACCSPPLWSAVCCSQTVPYVCVRSGVFPWSAYIYMANL